MNAPMASRCWSPVPAAGLETRVWSCIRQDGLQIAVSLTMSRITSRGGALIGFLGVARDVTA